MTESPASAKNRSHVDDDAIVKCLDAAYALDVVSIEFLPLGYDANAWVYRALARDGANYFLKLKRSIEHPTLLQVPHELRQRGLTRVVAPLATVSGALWTPIADVLMLLYPYIAGQRGGKTELTLAQWAEFGTVLGDIHGTSLPDSVGRFLPREEFQPTERYLTTARAVAAGDFDASADAISLELTEFLRNKRDLAAQIVLRCDELGTELRLRHWNYVLCHADIHVANILLDANGHVVVIDWDQPVFAPKERDLMLVSSRALDGFAAGSPEEAAFFDGYGPADIDTRALAYYRYAWAVEDVGSFVEEIARPGIANDGSRRRALDALRNVFGPNGIVEEAIQTDR